jgi:outer membrane protein OmpA-like peptidoglycan-associated protein
MKTCNSIKIELSSHTDSRASNKYNQELSTRRAKSSKAYLVEQGIDEQRTIAVGYGELKLVNECSDNVECTESQHQDNRRTEVLILEGTGSHCEMLESPDGRKFVIDKDFKVCPMVELIN